MCCAPLKDQSEVVCIMLIDNCARSCSAPVVNFRIYLQIGARKVVKSSIVELRSVFASCRAIAFGGELFIKT